VGVAARRQPAPSRTRWQRKLQGHGGQGAKVFCFLFSKKKHCSFLKKRTKKLLLC
jgi:hypothetical protein